MHSRPTSARDWIQHLYDSERLLLETWHSTAQHRHATTASPGRLNAQLQNALKNKIKIAQNMVWRIPREVFCIWFWKFPWRFLSVWTRTPSPGSDARSPLPCPGSRRCWRCPARPGRCRPWDSSAGGEGRGTGGTRSWAPAACWMRAAVPCHLPLGAPSGTPPPSGFLTKTGEPGLGLQSRSPSGRDTTCTRAGKNKDPACWQSAARPYIAKWRWGREPRNEILIQKFKRDHSLRHAWWRSSPVSPNSR